ncbi:MAG: hypothetical protein RBT25_07430 [Lentisphaeria bacterium]|nr:hypothetical protein [Lentisphaeria bacterium]
MPQNFPEIWLNRVIHNLDNTDKASFLDGISELDVNVTQINEGQLSEQNKIYVAATDFAVDVLLNNTTYPIPVQNYADDTIEITLDKYQTKVTSLTDDAIIGASYPKIDSVTRAHVHAIASNKYRKAIHAIAPAGNAAATPLHSLTAGKLTYADLIAFKDKCDKAGFEEDVIRLVLSPKHWNDLLLDRDRFADLLINHAAGKPAPLIAGFEIHRYAGNPYYTAAGAKKAWGAAIGGTDLQASVAFVKENIAKKTGLTKQYFSPAGTDPKNQANLLNYRHYFIALPFQASKIGAMA